MKMLKYLGKKSSTLQLKNPSIQLLITSKRNLELETENPIFATPKNCIENELLY